MRFSDNWKCNVKTFVKNPVLYPGNIIEGYVEITAKSEEIEFVAVRLKLVGKEKTCIQFFHDSREDNTVYDEPDVYTQSTTIFKQLVTLAGTLKHDGSNTSQIMPAGTWTYPFAFQLPMEIPPSFDHHSGGNFADCAYYVKAYIDIPGGRDASHKTHFTVLRPMPLIQWGHATPVSVDRSFDVTCCCCSKGSVIARLYMDRTVISIDRDNFTVYVDVDNTNGKEPVEGGELCLNNITKYNAMHLTKTYRNRVGQHKHIRQRIEPGAKGTIQGVVEIPPDIIPTCRTWNVSSENIVTLELYIPYASSLCHTFPVTVVQCVDDTNSSPPIVFSGCPYQALPKELCPEFVYVPPPEPVFAYSPIPSIHTLSGQSAPLVDYSYAQEHFRPLPSTAGWKHPCVYDDGRETYNDEVAWLRGVPQVHQAQSPVIASFAAAQPAAEFNGSLMTSLLEVPEGKVGHS